MRRNALPSASVRSPRRWKSSTASSIGIGSASWALERLGWLVFFCHDWVGPLRLAPERNLLLQERGLLGRLVPVLLGRKRGLRLRGGRLERRLFRLCRSREILRQRLRGHLRHG